MVPRRPASVHYHVRDLSEQKTIYANEINEKFESCLKN